MPFSTFARWQWLPRQEPFHPSWITEENLPRRQIIEFQTALFCADGGIWCARCKWPQPNVADMKTTCIVAVEDAFAHGKVHPRSSCFSAGGFPVFLHREPIYRSLLGIDYLLRHLKIKNTQSLAVISAPLNNNTHEIHNAASTCRDKSGKWPPPTDTGKVWIKRFAWTQWCVLPSACTLRPSIREHKTHRLSFQRTHSTEHFCPMTSNPPRDLMAFHWWGGGEEGRRKTWRGGGGGSVTLEKIRRLSSPLMTTEIVFLGVWGGVKMPKLSSLFCVAVRASCVRFRLRVSLTPQRPFVWPPQKTVQCWVIDRTSQPGKPDLCRRLFSLTSRDRLCGTASEHLWKGTKQLLRL